MLSAYSDLFGKLQRICLATEYLLLVTELFIPLRAYGEKINNLWEPKDDLNAVSQQLLQHCKHLFIWN